jgi:hypothetical protein
VRVGRERSGPEATDLPPLQLGQPFNPFKMFSGVLVPDELLRYRGLNPNAKLLWARLARYARDNGSVFPAVQALAGDLGLSARQIQRELASLERERFLRRSLRKTAKGG